MSIKEYVNNAVNQKKHNEGEQLKFTVGLNPYNTRRLEYIAQHLDIPKSAFARDLIIQALNDIAEALGLEEVDVEATVKLREDLIDTHEIDPKIANRAVRLTGYGEYVRNGDDVGDSKDPTSSNAYEIALGELLAYMKKRKLPEVPVLWNDDDDESFLK